VNQRSRKEFGGRFDIHVTQWYTLAGLEIALSLQFRAQTILRDRRKFASGTTLQTNVTNTTAAGKGRINAIA
jgi:hypothetical protein